MKTPSDYARSIRYAGLVILIATTPLVQACSSDTIPTGPSSVTPSSVTRPSAPEPIQARASGTVTDDEGVPVAGVKVTICSWTAAGQPCSAAFTDSRGFYSISFVSTAGVSARTEKAGYESAWHSLSISAAADFQFDLRIHRIKP
jgi:hypothetical protein